MRDFTTIAKKKFWAEVAASGDHTEDYVKKVWGEVSEGRMLTQNDAWKFLDQLFLYSHARIANMGNLEKYYPTKQYTKNGLTNDEQLWWVDHFTAGVSHEATLSWFSARKHADGRSKAGYSGASTHFVVPHYELPFFIIPLMHGAWHEPARNRDSISVEMVNTGELREKEGTWRYWPAQWTREVPEELMRRLPPVTLDKPFRGCKVMQPFTTEQLRNNIILKRIVMAALPGKLAMPRMSQHTDWKSGKKDMGPLWPFEDINDAAFNYMPLSEFNMLLSHEQSLLPGNEDTNPIVIEDGGDDHNSPEYGYETATHDNDDVGDDKVLTTREVQTILTKLGHALTVDNKFGPETKSAIKAFQRDWNRRRGASPALEVDGVPGPMTCKALLGNSPE